MEGQLFVRDLDAAGDRTDAVVFIHSLGGSSADWDAEMDLIGAGRRALAIDLPGFGRSPSPTGPMTMADYAAAVKAALDGAGVERCVLVGLSMGGMVALELATTIPDRVDGLVLCSTTAKVDETVRAILGTCEEAIDAAGMEGFAAGMVQQIFSPQILTDPPSVVERYIAGLRGGDPDGFKAAATAIAGHDTESRLGSLICPVMVVHGERDALIAPTNGERIAELIPAAQLTVFERCWHMSTLEEPGRFQAMLADFVARTSESAGAAA